jgi:hypothetical protein
VCSWWVGGGLVLLSLLHTNCLEGGWCVLGGLVGY